MGGVEQRTTTLRELQIEGNLGLRRVVIDNLLRKERDGFVLTWKGKTISGVTVTQIMRYEGGVRDPVIFAFGAAGTDGSSSVYGNVNFNPYERTGYYWLASDVVDFFVIAQKALIDDVTPRNIKAALEETFEALGMQGANTKKSLLSQNLSVKKYLI